eukprot:m51a1_g7177 hypothetical protein (324) ;mRNA; f:74649-75799
MDSEYLKREIGPVLSKAMAELSFARPVDPVDFLAQWLLTYDRQRKREIAFAAEMAQVDKQRTEREAAAAAERKRVEEEEAARKAEADAKEAARLAELNGLLEKYDKQQADALQVVLQLSERGSKAEPLAKFKSALQAARTALEDQAVKDYFLGLPKSAKADPTVAALIPLALYLVDSIETPEDSWKSCRKTLRNAEWLNKIVAFDPIQRQRVIKFRRAKRYLANIPEAQARTVSLGAFLLRDWLRIALEMRQAAVSYKNTKLGLPEETTDGEETDENSDEEEDLNQVVAKIVRAELEADEIERETRRREAEVASAEDEGSDDG